MKEMGEKNMFNPKLQAEIARGSYTAWSILTALRGPDESFFGHLKLPVTGLIRRWALEADDVKNLGLRYGVVTNCYCWTPNTAITSVT